jgi:hypothetical protein
MCVARGRREVLGPIRKARRRIRWSGRGYRTGMTTTPNEPVSDPDVVPSGDPVAPGEQPDPDTSPGPVDPDTPEPGTQPPDTQPL